MKYAVIISGGTQYRINEGEEILVDKLPEKSGEKIVFDKVLFFRTDDKILIGSPYLAQVMVSGKILSEEKGKKIHIIKFKAKAHYRRRIGFRPQYTKILIEKINLKEKETKKKGKSELTSVKK